MLLFHTTTRDAADSILASGFRDGSGTYGFATAHLVGVWLADEPLDVNEGAQGDTVLAVEFPAPDEELELYEVVEEHSRRFREFLIPAATLNARANVSTFDVGTELMDWTTE